MFASGRPLAENRYIQLFQWFIRVLGPEHAALVGIRRCDPVIIACRASDHSGDHGGNRRIGLSTCGRL
jgi:hypothetical protein